MKQAREPKVPQGVAKMEAYIQELVRNKPFRVALKSTRWPKKLRTVARYDEMTPEQRKAFDRFNAEIGPLLEGYELLRKKAKRIFGGRHFRKAEALAERYGLDQPLATFAEALLTKGPDLKYVETARLMADLDMCRVLEAHDFIHPFNKGEEIIHLNSRLKLQLLAYPVAIGIHPRASKRDVLDYIEKRWPWIEANFGLRDGVEAGALKIKKRKHSQKLLDFLWENRQSPPKTLKKRLDEEFPGNGLVYFEITRLLRYERQKREN